MAAHLHAVLNCNATIFVTATGFAGPPLGVRRRIVVRLSKIASPASAHTSGFIRDVPAVIAAYRIDIGVVDPRAPGRYLMGVECDGRTYHSGATARDRDRLRHVFLCVDAQNMRKLAADANDVPLAHPT